MLKLKLAALTFVAFALGACTETPPNVDFSHPQLFVLDKTEYHLEENELPPAQPKNAFLEDITGVRCVNCPAATEKAVELKEDPTYKGRVTVVGVYTGLFANLSTPHGTVDLRTNEATDIHSVYYGAPALPGGGVNRKLFKDQQTINQGASLWSSRVKSELDLKSDVNIEAALSWVNDSTVDINADFLFNVDREEEIYFSLILLEDDIIAPQTGGDSKTIENYRHNHVLRKMYTPYNGKPLISSPDKGRGVEVDWRVYLPENVNYNNSTIVLLLNLNHEENGEKNVEVLQCIELKLK